MTYSEKTIQSRRSSWKQISTQYCSDEPTRFELKPFLRHRYSYITQFRTQSHYQVVYEKNGTIGGSSLGSFSKASFVSKDEKEDVDINDPDFWQKAVGLTKDASVVVI